MTTGMTKGKNDSSCVSTNSVLRQDTERYIQTNRVLEMGLYILAISIHTTISIYVSGH